MFRFFSHFSVWVAICGLVRPRKSMHAVYAVEMDRHAHNQCTNGIWHQCLYARQLAVVVSSMWYTKNIFRFDFICVLKCFTAFFLICLMYIHTYLGFIFVCRPKFLRYIWKLFLDRFRKSAVVCIFSEIDTKSTMQIGWLQNGK